MVLKLPLKKRVHLIKRAMRGEKITGIARDYNVSRTTVQKHLTDTKYYAHWVALHAGMDIDILSINTGKLWENRKLIADLINHFDEQAAKFEKEPSAEYPFLYLDLSFRAYRSIAFFVRHYDGFDSLPVATIRQVIDVFNLAGFSKNTPNLGVATKLEFIEALRVRGLDVLWTPERRQEIGAFVAKYMEK